MRNVFKKVILGCCMVFPFFCCARKLQFVSYAPAEFEAFLKNKEDVQLVDVRRPDEFKAGHLEKAILINVLADDFLTKAKSLLDKSKPVAVYCRSGKRSKDAAEKLTKEGYTVYDLDSGYLGWIEYLKTK